MKRKKIVAIIDALSILVDAYYSSIPEALAKAKTQEEREEAFKLLETDENGRYIGAIRGLFCAIFDAVDKLNPTHLTVVWGTSRKTNIRKDIYANYKADANNMDEPLRQQIKTAQILLSSLVKQFTSNKYEAIDLAGTIADKLKDKAEIHILARNNNYLQLTDIATVYIKTPMAERLIEEHNLDTNTIPNSFFKYTKETLKYVKDLEPQQVLGFNALVGNPSSGIPGVKGVGATTALPVIKKYSTINNLYSQIENSTIEELVAIWKSIGVRNPTSKLLQGKENALISEKLLSICKDVYVEDNELDDIENKITLDKAATELSKIGLLSEFYVTEINESIKAKNLLELIHLDGTTNIKPTSLKSSKFSSLELPSNYSIEDELLSSSNIKNSEKDFYSIQVSTPSIFLNNDWDYVDYEEDYSDSEDYYCEPDEDVFDNIDDGGLYCEVETISTKINEKTREENNNQTISLLETIITKRYKCNCCNQIFELNGNTTVNFCVHCGSKNSSNEKNLIDNLEDTGLTMDDIRINKDIESVMEYI